MDPLKQAELMLAYYQQKLADAELQNAQNYAVLQLQAAELNELRPKPKDPNA